MNAIRTGLVAAATAGMLGTTSPADAFGTEDYLGSIGLTAATFCPRGTLEANGAILPISDNTALFSLLGTNYGGDGRTTFALPNLKDKVPLKDMHYCIVTQGIYPSRP